LTAFKLDHLQWQNFLFKDVVLALDADEAGEEGAGQMAPVLEALSAKMHRLAFVGDRNWNQVLA